MKIDRTSAERQQRARAKQLALGRRPVQFMLSSEAVAALDAWCVAQGKTRSEMVEAWCAAAGRRL